MTIKTIRYLILLMLISVNSFAYDLDQYQVEILLFKQKSISANETEVFKEGVSIPDIKNSLEIPLDETEDTAIQKIKNSVNKISKQFEYLEKTEIHPKKIELMQLDAMQNNIKRSSYYHLLLHTAWRQLGLDNEHAIKVRITDGAPFVVIKNTVNSDIPNIAIDYHYLLQEWDKYYQAQSNNQNIKQENEKLATIEDEPSDEIPSLPEELFSYLRNINLQADIVYPLDGTIKVVRTRYLHMYVDLLWTVKRPKEIKAKNEDEEIILEKEFNLTADDEALDEKPDAFIASLETLNLQSYPFKAHRKMRSKKQHYIDHPKIGLVTIIMPVLSEEKELN